MVSASSNPDGAIGALVPKNDIPLLKNGVGLAEDKSFRAVDEVVPRPGKARTYFNRPTKDSRNLFFL